MHFPEWSNNSLLEAVTANGGVIKVTDLRQAFGGHPRLKTVPVLDGELIHKDAEHLGQALEGERLDGAVLDVDVRQLRTVHHIERVELIRFIITHNRDVLYRLVAAEVQIGDTCIAKQRHCLQIGELLGVEGLDKGCVAQVETFEAARQFQR